MNVKSMSVIILTKIFIHVNLQTTIDEKLQISGISLTMGNQLSILLFTTFKSIQTCTSYYAFDGQQGIFGTMCF